MERYGQVIIVIRVLYKSTKYCKKKKMHFFSIKEVYIKRQEDRNNAFFLVLNNCTKYFVKKNVEHKIRKLVEKKN